VTEFRSRRAENEKKGGGPITVIAEPVRARACGEGRGGAVGEGGLLLVQVGLWPPAPRGLYSASSLSCEKCIWASGFTPGPFLANREFRSRARTPRGWRRRRVGLQELGRGAARGPDCPPCRTRSSRRRAACRAARSMPRSSPLGRRRRRSALGTWSPARAARPGAAWNSHGVAARRLFVLDQDTRCQVDVTPEV